MSERIQNKIKELEIREKVIKGLEWCMMIKHDCYSEKGCPYENEAEDIGCKYALHRDALALLKAQEARVMTLEEVENAIDTVVWVDRPTTKNESELFGLIQAYSRKFKYIQIKHIEMNMGEHMLYPYETYGKEWRCWDKHPTDEQRKAVPWNRRGENDETGI